LLEGIRATTDIFESRMKALGLTPFDSLGAEFDPELHEAVEIVPVAPEEDNLVVAELQPGYRFGERLLRPARVRVGRATEDRAHDAS
jgi:molecular chaperone GrpE